MTAIATKHQDRAELIRVLESSLYPGAQTASIEMVLGYCEAAGLDVMQKPVHIVPMWDAKAGRMRDVVMPGVGLYRTQASRTGQFAGMTEPEFGPDITRKLGDVDVTFPEWCRVTAKRLLPSGIIAEFPVREYWIENYAAKGGKENSIAPNAVWTKRPRGQLSKCTSAQALRLAFPEHGAAPTADEMEGKAIPGDELERGRQMKDMGMAQEVKTWPSDVFATQFSRWEKAVQGGVKTIEEIIALAESRGALTAEQRTQINGIKRAQPKVADDFVDAYDAAEGGEQQ